MATANVDIRISGASAVIVHNVAPASVQWFVEWQQGVAEAAQRFAGYQNTSVYPPPGGREGHWVAVVTFADEHSLRTWLDSPVRAEWVAKLQERTGDFDLHIAPVGFAPWFASCVQGPGDPPPPGWKMALVVLLGLYPTVMLLTLFPGPYTQPLGMAAAMLIGNALSVSILQWGVMPVLTFLFGPWLKADPEKRPLFSRSGAVVIAVLLAGLTALFHHLTG